MPATTAPRPCRQSASGSTSARRTRGPTVPRRRSSSNTDVVVKLSVVRRAASGEDKEALAREVGVSLKTLKRWCKASESLAQFEVTASHNRARNRRFPVLPDLDKAMLEWVVQQRVRDSRLHGGHITEKARQVNAALGGPASFKASNGWLRCFLRRHGLHRRVSAAEPAAGEHDDNQDDVAGEQVSAAESAAEVHMDDAEDASGEEVWAANPAVAELPTSPEEHFDDDDVVSGEQESGGKLSTAGAAAEKQPSSPEQHPDDPDDGGEEQEGEPSYMEVLTATFGGGRNRHLLDAMQAFAEARNITLAADLLDALSQISSGEYSW